MTSSPRARGEFPAVRWLVGDAAPLPFRDAAFDALFAGELIEHLPDSRPALAEFRRVVKPGGTLILTTPNRLRLANVADGSERPYSPDHLSELSYDEVRSLLGESGFEVLKSTGLHLELLLNWFSPLPKLDRLQRGWNRRWAVPLMRLLLQAGRAPAALRARPRVRGPAAVRGVNGPSSGRGAFRLAGVAAAALWLLLVWRWFDADTPPRPAWLAAVPPLFLALPAALLFALWLRARRDAFRFERPAFLAGGDLALPVLLAILFRLPFVGQGAAGAVTPDGALSGIVMLRVLNGAEHFVFVPNVPYSGSLKSHLGAPLALVLDGPRAFALASVLFYALYVAALVRLAALVPGASRTVVLGAGLYAAFAPPFVTRYSLSNDGNYVEVLALGTWALLFAVRWVGSPTPRLLALAAGLLLGLAFWCHILAVIPLVVVGLVLLLYDPRRALRSLPALAAGWVLGNAPGLLWNSPTRANRSGICSPGGRRSVEQKAAPGWRRVFRVS